LVGGLAAFLMISISIVLFSGNNVLLLIVVSVECLAILYFWHDRYDLCFLLVIGIFGSLGEAFFVQFGVWRYSNPTFIGVPLWFPVAFGTSGLIAGRWVRAITGGWKAIDSERTLKE
jgi:hypothetical protein